MKTTVHLAPGLLFYGEFIPTARRSAVEFHPTALLRTTGKTLVAFN
jgi:hypothetical protein